MLRRLARNTSCFLLAIAIANGAQAARIDIDGPADSDSFGERVLVLPNGNLVVVDRDGGPDSSGAVHLYRPNGERISSLYGSTYEDFVGLGGIEVLPTGDFLVFSPFWDNGPVQDAGAMTWVSGASGLEGTISAANSLVGTKPGDQVGLERTRLTNGNFVIVSKSWDAESNGTFTENVGAITFVRATQPPKGPVSSTNSLVGLAKDDGFFIRIVELTNGHFLVLRGFADVNGVADAGMATWVNGTVGATGPITAARSFVGAQAQDLVGFIAYPLPGGRVALGSAAWDKGAVANVGAVSLQDGAGPIVGVLSEANALTGSSANDYVGTGGVYAVGGGRVLVSSPSFDANGIVDAGAVTIIPAISPSPGLVTPANSLTGATTGDEIGSAGTTILPSGNAVVQSPKWDSSTEFDVGATTWLDPAGLPGQVVSSGNSLYAPGFRDEFGKYVVVLANGHYVVPCSYCNIGDATNSGAVVWASGTARTTGLVGPTNAIHGRSNEDYVGERVLALPNGNYVIASRLWDDRFDNRRNAGAATWVDGATGIARNEGAIGAEVSPLNSFVGSHPDDEVSSGTLGLLTNGNYVVGSPRFDFAPAFGIKDSGAVTWGDGATGLVGKPAFANSLFGQSAGDGIGEYTNVLPGGRYVVTSPSYDGGPTAPNIGAATWGDGVSPLTGLASTGTSLTPDGGAEVYLGQVVAFENGDYAVIAKRNSSNGVVRGGSVTFARGATGVYGVPTASNTVFGTVANGGERLVVAYAPKIDAMVVGQPAANRVTIFDEKLFGNGFE